MSSADDTSAAGPRAGRAYALLTITALCWAANAIFGQLAVGEVSPMAMTALRWLGVLILIAVFARRPVQRDWPALRAHLPFIAAMGAIGFAMFNALFYAAAYSTTAINIGILQGSIPVFVMLGAFLAYRTPVGAMQAAGVAVTTFGVVIVACAGSPLQLLSLSINRGDGLMLLACLIYAGYAVGLRRRPPVSALGLFTVMAGAAFVVSLPLVAGEMALGRFQWPTPAGWAVVALVTLFPSFLAQICFIEGVARIGPGRAGVFVNLVPVFAAVFAVVVLDESFEAYHAVALVLVLGGIWLSERMRPA